VSCIVILSSHNICLAKFIWMLPFNLLHDFNFLSISFLSSDIFYFRGLNSYTCFIMHCHSFYFLNVIATHSLDIIFVAESWSVFISNQKYFYLHHITFFLSQWWIKELIKQVFWVLQWSYYHLHPKVCRITELILLFIVLNIYNIGTISSFISFHLFNHSVDPYEG
jgi:hypothetical protein